ncbi:hypothetical protein F1737_07365 [Methanoplanus sp. FWC-SCC4]|uniref:Uncharacterized protein n=1 Tax=Methanochimaera problematica TaxID=2609417 RepID=A0AA97I3B6_9EURY|nr:hypothetical protein [Methanoplanus sp. FWC-SCC4]WOF16528.1 hypothetical protein F1737_07365 [Methanoplanus sp. FWC-SCC4]
MYHIDREDGLSEVVGFILILGLIVVAMSVYLIYEIPSQGRENEIKHMNDIKNRFVDFKISLDSLWINSVGSYTGSSLKYPTYGVTLANSFDLGTSGGFYTGGSDIMPFFTPIPSSGTMSVDKNHGSIRVTMNEGEEVLNTTLGILKYSSQNNYWVEQDYYYQMGGVFLLQDSGITIRVDPLVSIYNVGGKAAVQITPVSVSGEQFLGGSGPLRVEARLKQAPQYLSGKRQAKKVTITVYCENADEADCWERVFKNTLAREGTSNWCELRVAGNIVSANVHGPDVSGASNDVELDVYRADYNVWLQNVASAIE